MTPFLDSHFHLWDLDHDRLRYDWLEQAQHPVLGEIPQLARSFAVDEYLQATDGLGVAAAVHVQADASDALGETEWLRAVSEASGWPQAIVAFVDFTAGDWAASLEAQAASPLVRGIRDLKVGSLANGRRDWSDPRLERALRQVASHGLHYELRMTSAETNDVIALLRRLDGVRVVLTHAALPLDRSPDALEAWSRSIRRLAEVDSLSCKLSGFGMGSYVSGIPWSTDDVAPLVTTCIEAFGTERSFFGSNWPVETLSVSYRAMLDSYREIVGAFSGDEQRRLLAGNAGRIYGIPV